MSSTTRFRSLEILSVMVLLVAGPVGADSYNVDRFDDSTASACSIYSGDDCGLRGALIRANANPGDDVIWLHSGVYTLSIEGPGEDLCQTGDLDVTDTVRIVGPGPERTTIDAGGDAGVNDRVFDVHAPGKKLTLRGLAGRIEPRQDVTVEVARPDGSKASLVVTARLDTPVEVNYYRNGGILQTVLRKML